MGLVSTALLLAGDGPGDETAKPELRLTLWGHSADEVGGLTQTRRSPRLPGFLLHDSVKVSTQLARTIGGSGGSGSGSGGGGSGADLVVSAIPAQFTRSVWKRLRGKLPRHVPVVSVAKGIENETLLRPTEIIADCLGDDPDAAPRPMGVLSGPTIAAELARGLPATMIAASEDHGLALTLQRLFSTSYLRIYTSSDVKGVELAGAMKNVIAIAAGILDGLQAGYNAKSALLARGLAEIARLSSAMGARKETCFGITGIGDLATSCFSPEGRNRSCGEALGKGKTLEQYLKKTTSVVEGVATTRSVMMLAEQYRVEMPITRSVHSVLFEGVDPIEAIARLMSREQKAERVG